MKVWSLLAAVFFGWALGAGATEFHVSSTLDEVDATPGDNSCVSTPSGVCTLRAAIMEANAHAGHDDITVPAGHYVLSLAGLDEDAAATGDLDVRESVFITGAGIDLTVIDADQIDRVFEVVLDDLSLQDLTVQNGSAITSGSASGGGIYHGGTNLWLTRVRLTGNQANLGGGLKVAHPSWAIVQASTFDHNSLLDLQILNQWGAAVHSNGTLSLSSTTVTANSNALGSTEVIHLEGCNTEFSNISDSTIALNDGGGVYAYNCTLTLNNDTIYGNSGHGVDFGVFTGLDFTLTVSNSIIAGSSTSDCFLPSGTLAFSHTLDGDDTCGLNLAEGDLPATDPVLLPLRSWGGSNQALYPKPGASPVIDAGGGSCTPFDQRLVTRPVDGDGNGSAVCDMGAIEAGDLIVWAGHETGLTDEWSTTVGSTTP